MVELVVRRYETTDWQVAVSQRGEQVAMLLASPPSNMSGDFRNEFWNAYASSGTEFHLADESVVRHTKSLQDQHL